MVAEIPTTGPRCRKRGHGWDAVASSIVIDMAHLLPPPAPNLLSWLLSERHYYRADASLVVDTYEGRWRDEQTGEGGTVFTLLVRRLGSWGAARRWLREGKYMYGIGPGPQERAGRAPGAPLKTQKRERRGSGGGPILESCPRAADRGGGVPRSSCRRPARAVARGATAGSHPERP